LSITAPTGRHQVEEGLSATGIVEVRVDGQAYSSDPASPAFVATLAGAGPASLTGIAFSGGGQAALTLDDQALAGGFTVTSDSPVVVAGRVNAGGSIALTAPALAISGSLCGTAIALDSGGMLQVLGSAIVSAEAGSSGGTIRVAVGELINSGTIQADGATGGAVTLHAGTIMNFGAVTADGSTGAGGTVTETFTTSYLDTTSTRTAANGPVSGGQVSLDGGSGGRLFTSGSFDTTGASGGAIDLVGKDVLLIAATPHGQPVCSWGVTPHVAHQ
jgi:hypothetical protein